MALEEIIIKSPNFCRKTNTLVVCCLSFPQLQNNTPSATECPFQETPARRSLAICPPPLSRQNWPRLVGHLGPDVIRCECAQCLLLPSETKPMRADLLPMLLIVIFSALRMVPGA